MKILALMAIIFCNVSSIYAKDTPAICDLSLDSQENRVKRIKTFLPKNLKLPSKSFLTSEGFKSFVDNGIVKSNQINPIRLSKLSLKKFYKMLKSKNGKLSLAAVYLYYIFSTSTVPLSIIPEVKLFFSDFDLIERIIKDGFETTWYRMEYQFQELNISKRRAYIAAAASVFIALSTFAIYNNLDDGELKNELDENGVNEVDMNKLIQIAQKI